MVEPSWLKRGWRILVLGSAGLAAGCSVVPGSRVDECHKMTRTLQADNSRLKDSLLSQRSQNEDLAQRADDDARRLKVQDEEIRRLTASVEGYRNDRDQLDKAFAQLKERLQVAANPLSGTMSTRLESFAKGRPGCELVHGDQELVVTLATDPLFVAGTDRLKPEGEALLRSFADLLAAPDSRDVRLLVAGHTAVSAVGRAGYRTERPKGGHLSLDRAVRVRDLLALEAKIEPTRIEAAGFESSRPRDTGPDEAAMARNRRIEIHLRPAAPAAEAAGSRGP